MSRRAFTHLPVGPWPRGMARPARRTDIPPDALEDAVNVDVRPEGSAATRPRWSRVAETDGAHSIYEHEASTFAVLDGNVGRLLPDGFEPMMAVPGRISWTDLAGTPCFATRDAVWQVVGDTVERLSSEDSPADDHDRDDPLIPMPGGHWLEYWNGRLVVARGSTLLFSEPLRYDVHNPMTGYISLGGWIEWMVALEGGLYVGLADRVLWLAGTQLRDLRVVTVAGRSAPGMALAVPGEVLGAEAPGRFAVFLTASGFAVGDASGTVTYPQSDRFNDLPLHRGKLFRDATRIYAVRES